MKTLRPYPLYAVPQSWAPDPFIRHCYCETRSLWPALLPKRQVCVHCVDDGAAYPKLPVQKSHGRWWLGLQVNLLDNVDSSVQEVL